MNDQFLYEISAIYAHPINRKIELDNIIQKHKELRNKIAELDDLIQKEENFSENSNYQLEMISDKLNATQRAYEEAKNSVEISAIENAKVCSSKDEPFIFQINNIVGCPDFVNITRSNSQILYLKKIYLHKLDKLTRLRRSVYCTNTQEENLTQEELENLGISIPQDQAFDSIKCPMKNPKYNASSDILSIISENLNYQQEFLDNFDFNRAEFYSKHSTSKDVNHLIQKFFATSENQNKILEEKRNELNSFENRIERIDNEKNEVLSQIKDNIQGHITNLQQNGFLFSSNIIRDAQSKIQHAQTILDGLEKSIHAENHEVYASDTNIKLLINDISNDIQNIYKKYDSLFIVPKIDPIVIDKPQKIVVDHISSEQINRCKDKLDKLESNLQSSDSYHKIAIEELKEVLDSLLSVVKSRDFELSNHKENDIPNDDIQSHVQKFLEMKNKVLAKQKEDISKLKDMIELLPDSIRGLEVDGLPKYENNQNKFSIEDLTHQPLPPVSDPYSDSNEVLLKKIIERKVEIKEEQIEIEQSNSSNSYTDNFGDQIAQWTKLLSLDFSKQDIEKRNKLQQSLTKAIGEDASARERKIARHEANMQRQEKLKNLREEVAQMREKYNQSNSICQRAQATIEELQKKNSNNATQLANIQEENDMLITESRQYEELLKRKQELEKEIEELQQNSRNEIDSLRSQIKAKTQVAAASSNQ